jgi:hypothetical protein
MIVAVILLLAGCGESSDPPTGYVTLDEADYYFSVYYGGRWKCRGHGPPDHAESLVDPAITEVIEKAGGRANLLPFSFASCRLLSGGNKQAREDRVEPGSVLTYGIP